MRLNRCLNLDLDLFFDNCAALIASHVKHDTYILTPCHAQPTSCEATVFPTAPPCPSKGIRSKVMFYLSWFPWSIALVMLGEYVFAVGGQGDVKSEDSLERYDPQANSWQLTESVGVAAYADADLDSYKPATVVALDGLLYFIGMEQVYTLVLPFCLVFLC